MSIEHTNKPKIMSESIERATIPAFQASSEFAETMNILTPSGHGGPVIYGSQKAEPEDKERLVTLLLDTLARLETRFAAFYGQGPIILEKDFMGRPRLLVGDAKGPKVSFCHACSRTWAAMYGGCGVGIDVAFPDEFQGDYPLERVFRQREFVWAREFCGDDPAQTAALLWSLKEAAVKALGCGFNLFDPLDIEAKPIRSFNSGLFFQVSAGRPLLVWARQAGFSWLSIALIE
jgi:phosphopantetheinyl transferase